LPAEDLEGSSEKINFFTGIVNFGTFMLPFNSITKEAGKLNYWQGKDSLKKRVLSSSCRETKARTPAGGK